MEGSRSSRFSRWLAIGPLAAVLVLALGGTAMAQHGGPFDHGSFVIGDENSAVGTHVTYWGAQWWKIDDLSGGATPASFKGFAAETAGFPPACGSTWTTRPGNSSGPPDGVPDVMPVIASSHVTKRGPVISGDVAKVVLVETDPGYGPAPGHVGRGTVIGVVCVAGDGGIDNT
jgi:hypothetical protein